jgi:hypothetical protein
LPSTLLRYQRRDILRRFFFLDQIQLQKKVDSQEHYRRRYHQNNILIVIVEVFRLSLSTNYAHPTEELLPPCVHALQGGQAQG